MPRRRVTLTRKQILNSLAHIRQWVGFVSTAVENYNPGRRESVFYLASGGPTPPPMKIDCPPAEEECPPECYEKKRRKGKHSKNGKKAR
jgi:hypothetical protein